MTTFIRRRGLGYTSCNGVADKMEGSVNVARSDGLIPNDAVMIRWGCTATIPHPCSVINLASAIHEVSEKGVFRKKMADAGLAPETWLSIDNCPTSSIEQGVVTRPMLHAGGRDFNLSFTWDGVAGLAQQYGEASYYISKYIPKEREFRVVVAQGRVVFVVEKVVDDVAAHAWNRSLGARFVPVKFNDWNLRVVRTAVEAHALSSLHFSGADLMVDAEGNVNVLELNSAPTLTSPYRQTCMAKVFDWMLQFGRADIPRVEERGGWKKFIHPAVSDRALMVEGAVV